MKNTLGGQFLLLLRNRCDDAPLQSLVVTLTVISARVLWQILNWLKSSRLSQ